MYHTFTASVGMSWMMKGLCSGTLMKLGKLYVVIYLTLHHNFSVSYFHRLAWIDMSKMYDAIPCNDMTLSFYLQWFASNPDVDVVNSSHIHSLSSCKKMILQTCLSICQNKKNLAHGVLAKHWCLFSAYKLSLENKSPGGVNLLIRWCAIRHTPI